MIARYLELHQYLLTAFADTHHSFMIEGNDIEFLFKLVTLVSNAYLVYNAEIFNGTINSILDIYL